MYPDRSVANCSPMDKEASTLFIKCVVSEASRTEKAPLEAFKRKENEEPFPFLSEIAYKRVTAMELPISFTLEAYLAISAFCSNPGQAVVLLVDCLTHHKGELITTGTLANLYPWGFYSMETFELIVDDFMKPKKVQWSDIY